MANRIEIQLDDSQVRQRLEQLMGALADSRPLMAGIAAELAAQTELTFHDQGPGWEKLKPATIRARQQAGKWPGPILQVSNALARSITARSGADFAQLGSNMPYAAIHQFGGTIDRAPYGGKLRLRTDRKGNLLRRGKNGKLVSFAREKGAKPHKNYVERQYEVQAYQIHIPARPFLPVSRDGRLTPNALEAVMGVLNRALSG